MDRALSDELRAALAASRAWLGEWLDRLTAGHRRVGEAADQKGNQDGPLAHSRR